MLFLHYETLTLWKRQLLSKRIGPIYFVCYQDLNIRCELHMLAAPLCVASMSYPHSISYFVLHSGVQPILNNACYVTMTELSVICAWSHIYVLSLQQHTSWVLCILDVFSSSFNTKNMVSHFTHDGLFEIWNIDIFMTYRYTVDSPITKEFLRSMCVILLKALNCQCPMTLSCIVTSAWPDIWSCNWSQLGCNE